MLLVASADARRESWSAQAAIALADRCAAHGSCILIDLVIEGGELHQLLGADNTEGIADVFLFGASLRHVVQRPQGHSFEFAAAGAPSDTATILEHSRWLRLLSEQERSGVTLLLYVPSDAPGLELFSRRIRSVIALSRESELPSISARVSEPARLAVISPVETRTDAAAAAQPETTVERDNKHSKEQFEAIRVPRDAAREALIADLRARQRAALMAPAATAEPPAEDGVGGVTERTVRRPAPRVKPAPSITEPTFVTEVSREPVKSRRLFYWLISLAVLAAIAVGAWLVITQQLPPRQAANANTSNTATDVPPSRGAPIPAEVPTNALLYSVAIEAHQQLPVALERVRALRSEEPAMSFYISPIVANNAMYYQVMAGPVADSASAGALLLRLLEKGHKTGAAPGEVKRAQLAFLLGEFDTRGAAEGREKEAAELGIPAYIIEVQGSTGATRYRVYAGAYSSPTEANVMKQMLVNVGLPATLVPRVGKQR